MRASRDALRGVARRQHLGALVLALEDVAKATGPLPAPARALLLAAHELLFSLGLAGRSRPWDEDSVRRSVWRSGVDSHLPPSPEAVEAWADAAMASARSGGLHAATQLLLAELADDPGALAEVAGLLAVRVVGS